MLPQTGYSLAPIWLHSGLNDAECNSVRPARHCKKNERCPGNDAKSHLR